MESIFLIYWKSQVRRLELEERTRKAKYGRRVVFEDQATSKEQVHFDQLRKNNGRRKSGSNSHSNATTQEAEDAYKEIKGALQFSEDLKRTHRKN